MLTGRLTNWLWRNASRGESQEHILSRMRSGTPLLVSAESEADYIADAWAYYDDKVQLHAIRIVFKNFLPSVGEGRAR